MTPPYLISSRYDVVVVGARVAGSSVAMLLARAGLRVLLVDKAAPGRDTVSTHALMRAGVMQLRRWGLLDRIARAGTPPIRRTTFHYGPTEIQVPIKQRNDVDALYAPRRTVLDVVLAQAAARSGADVAFKTSVEQVLRDYSGRICGVVLNDANGGIVPVHADLVIGADGANSSIARMVRAEVQQQARIAAPTIYGYWSGLNLDGTHWFYGSRCASGVIPTNNDQACAFVAMPSERFHGVSPRDFGVLFREVMNECSPEFGAMFAAADGTANLTAFPGRPGYLRQAWGPGWALVGDAGCFKDPITAHGITDAFRDAELLARAIIVGGDDAALGGYQEARDHFAVEFLELSEAIASFDWDLEQVQSMHRRLSAMMNEECDFIASLPAAQTMRFDDSGFSAAANATMFRHYANMRHFRTEHALAG